ncbi:hypothetical protein NQ317_005522 [Molorchus minor]|uniref:D-2-hydroxyglutarate dehydrogenase, mitochondrial n=1 Tax=Molorchus minor TaxID=1323400 RepID=A0ABQ9J1R2_9CUCU|nr:hypothetical protein NQ317_005522 [Molorchus minor]
MMCHCLLNITTLVDDMRSRMGNRCERVFGYGHLGDSNLHLQIQMKEYSQELRALAEPYIYKRTAELKGSISAEHGMGFMKRNYLKLAKSSSYVSQMRGSEKNI